jgi:hypothetical protein
MIVAQFVYADAHARSFALIRRVSILNADRQKRSAQFGFGGRARRRFGLAISMLTFLCGGMVRLMRGFYIGRLYAAQIASQSQSG